MNEGRQSARNRHRVLEAMDERISQEKHWLEMLRAHRDGRESVGPYPEGSGLSGDKMVSLLMLSDEELPPEFADQVGRIVNDLLGLLYEEYPIQRIVPLLRSDVFEVMSVALWLVDELPKRVIEVAGELVPLLAHEDWRTGRRAAWILGSIEQVETGIAAAIVSLLVEQPDLEGESSAEIVYCALRLLAGASTEQLEDVAEAVADEETREMLLWLAEDLDDREAEESHVKQIVQLVLSRDPLAGVFAAVAAARIVEVAAFPLEELADSGPFAIRDFARERLGLGERTGGRWNF